MYQCEVLQISPCLYKFLVKAFSSLNLVSSWEQLTWQQGLFHSSVSSLGSTVSAVVRLTQEPVDFMKLCFCPFALSVFFWFWAFCLFSLHSL